MPRVFFVPPPPPPPPPIGGLCFSTAQPAAPGPAELLALFRGLGGTWRFPRPCLLALCSQHSVPIKTPPRLLT